MRVDWWFAGWPIRLLGGAASGALIGVIAWIIFQEITGAHFPTYWIITGGIMGGLVALIAPFIPEDQPRD